MGRMSKYASPAAIITHTRSGGTFLAACLSNHPDIFCPRGEPLLRGDAPERTAEWLRAFPSASAIDVLRCIGAASFYKVGMCKITYPQATEEVLAHLKEVGARIIHLTRKNVVRVAVSQYITGAVVTGALPDHTEHTGRPVDPVSIVLQPGGFIERCRWLVEQQQKMTAALAALGLPVLPLTYADMMDGEGHEGTELPQWLSHYICEFLGVERRILGSHLRRVNHYPPSTLVSNWSQLREQLELTEFQWCLDEEDKIEYRRSDS